MSPSVFSAARAANLISTYLLTGMHHSTPEGKAAIADIIVRYADSEWMRVTTESEALQFANEREATLAAVRAERDELQSRFNHLVTLYQSAEKELGQLQDYTQHHLHDKIEALRASLENIATTAHCVALSGPATTPTLQDAWGKFMKIESMAVEGLREARKLDGKTEEKS